MSNTDLHLSTPPPWTIAGGPSPGTVAALGVHLNDGYTVFAGTRAGLYRGQWSPMATTSGMNRDAKAHWRRLPASPLEIVSLGVSPEYSRDSTILAGSAQGLFVSRDGGGRWQAAHTPMPDPVVLCFCFSPSYGSDGIILAGALEDGVYYSDSRGERWSYRGFGLLDAAVYSLAISPDFGRDETVFAGAESTLYYSYNGARAWKPLDFPENAAPILSLALSPHFAQDQTLYAGTEDQGLYWSADLGKIWQKAELPATCVNALAISPAGETLLAATNAGLFCSDDRGLRWSCLFDMPDIFSVVASNGAIIASLADQGAWWRRNGEDWRPFFTTPARSLTGMALSPCFDLDATVYLYGPQEGVWRTRDGGLSWSCLNERLPGLDIRSMALSPYFAQDGVLVAASGDGILMSEDGGDHWTLLAVAPKGAAAHVAFSPGGRFVAAGSPAGEIWISQSLKDEWQRLPISERMKGQVLALAIDNNCRLRVALCDQMRESLSIWQGEPGRFAQILRRPAGPTPVVRFWDAGSGASGEAWCASLDHEIWEFQRAPADAGEDPISANRIFALEDGGRILALAGCQTRSGSLLFACTGRTIYQSTKTGSWAAVHDFGDERAVALALSPTYPDDPTAFALLLGGSFCRGILK